MFQNFNTFFNFDIAKVLSPNFAFNMWCVARFGSILQFKKREKHPWRNVNFSKVAG